MNVNGKIVAIPVNPIVREDLEKVYQEVCRVFEHNPEDIKKKHHRDAIIIRTIYYMMAKKLFPYSSSQIGAVVGIINYSTVVKAIRKARMFLEIGDRFFTRNWKYFLQNAQSEFIPECYKQNVNN